MSRQEAQELQRGWMQLCPQGRRGLNHELREMAGRSRVASMKCESGLGEDLWVVEAAVQDDAGGGAVVPFLIYHAQKRELLVPPGLEPPHSVQRKLAVGAERCVTEPDVENGPLRGLIGTGPPRPDIYTDRERRQKHHWETMLPATVFAKNQFFLHSMARYALAARTTPLRGARVVDAGCGAGYGARYLARHARRVTAVETDSVALDYARRYYDAENIQWVKDNAAELSPGEQSADIFLAFELLEHLEEPRRLLRRARELLAPGGILMLSTPCAATRRDDGPPNPFHVHEYAREELRKLVRPVFPGATVRNGATPPGGARGRDSARGLIVTARKQLDSTNHDRESPALHNVCGPSAW